MGARIEKVSDWLSGHHRGGKERREATVLEWVGAYRALFVIAVGVASVIVDALDGSWLAVVAWAAAVWAAVWYIRWLFRIREYDDE